MPSTLATQDLLTAIYNSNAFISRFRPEGLVQKQPSMEELEKSVLLPPLICGSLANSFLQAYVG